MLYAEIIIDMKIPYSHKCFDYIITEKQKNKIKKGMRVIVPFGKKNNLRLGYILKIKDKSDFANKKIEDVLDQKPFLNDELFLLAEEILKIPFVNIASAYGTVLPRSFLTTYFQKIHILEENKLPQEIKNYLIKKNKIISLKDSFIPRKELLKLQKKKLLKHRLFLIKKIIDHNLKIFII
ncbi:MAG: hypothetical protein Q8777_02070 [Candidatus Phytoplasma stylosanthis]|uniref:primosomal protein N' family DNA-binding protein n=1 Tax=Candidatus Phytoplasma stylosanthis TaxID=2798314 RepID=UPI00293B29E2|nr:hypothetical protein [Candidatus Phytoplasma stylosanthis]MDV3168135.1 hypothetical protein [Candidatus Phytoplasma stylosanthis]